MGLSRASIEAIRVEVFTIPTDASEADGTIDWDRTTIIVVHAAGGGATGVGYTYSASAAAVVIRDTLAPAILGGDVFDIEHAYVAMRRAIRNFGRDGITASAISAVDTALWDLKARLLDVPLVGLIGGVRDAIPLYGSGGFTSYTTARLTDQLAGWARNGLRAVKMKIGRDAVADRARVTAARHAVGPDVALFVDANGAYPRKTALDQAHRFERDEVSWFEEPVPSHDLEGLRLIRDRAPAGMEIAAGEYGYDIQYFRRMLEAGSVDVLQADATRCGGITGLLRAGALAEAFDVPLSAHTAPSLHAHVCCAIAPMRHLEYFHDHVRIEHLLFDGVPEPEGGVLTPDRSRPGHGLSLKRAEAERLVAT